MLVEDFIVENGEIEGKTQTDWVCWWHLLFADLVSLFVGIL